MVVSVKGSATARELLESSGDALSGRSVVNLTDGTSAEVRAVADWAAGRGAQYLHGQIMTIAPGIGGADTVIFYGGSEAVYDRYRTALRLIGGRGTLVADDAGVPTLYGMAVHGTMWGTLNGFLHAAALLSSEGIEVKRFPGRRPGVPGRAVGVLPDDRRRGRPRRVRDGVRGTPTPPPSVEDLVRESEARNIDAEFPRYTLGLVNEAVEAGHADDSYARLVEHFRNKK
ncbi:hypothetical protein R1T08_00020 [Streptomyces sp. SBC-4]|nr:hypothetical protein [Streptomyces sp. SBC-4]MDV5142758.1 hypothetical protein [Streptomyces sp. SBC-4]